MREKMTTGQLCRKLNRMLKTKYLTEVLERLGDRCEEIDRDADAVTNPATYSAIGKHAVAYLRWYDEFVPVRRMGDIPQSAWNAYVCLGISFTE